jgi:magnesium-transporting ATPase (P-type)
LFWDGETDSYLDIRLFYVNRNRETWSKCRWDPQDTSIPRFWRFSDVTDYQICYTVEANKYAQGAFLISIVLAQVANGIILRTRSLSIAQHGFKNIKGVYALFFEFFLIIFISYIRPLEIALGTRAVASPHFMVPAFTYYMLYFMYDEARKVFVRSGTDQSVPGKMTYHGWFARHSFW